MRQCLLISSTFMEIEPIVSTYRENVSRWNGIELDILITGIGLTSTTYSLTRHLFRKRPELVVQAGIAGAIDDKIKPGLVYAISHDRIADEMVIEKKEIRTISELGLRDKDQFPYRRDWLKNPHKDVIGLSGLSSCRAISVNQVTTDKMILRKFRKTYNASLESMEGAACHFVCLSENIPFLQLRAVSNFAGDRDKKKWKLGRSVRQLNKSLDDLFHVIAAAKTDKT